MPLYAISHCIPLAREQKDALAEFITDLHATKFVTPRLFVNVSFDEPGPRGDLYAGAKHRGRLQPNHIRTLIRTGPTRTKESFDEVGLAIQKKWSDIVNDTSLGAQSLDHLSAKEQQLMKGLHAVVFCPMVAAIEHGLVVPAAGGEGQWLEENLPEFQRRIDEHGDIDTKEMLDEIKLRDDLKHYVQ